MAVFKCKMCGGNIDVTEGKSVALCEYCGTRQTVSCNDDEKRVNLYNRANRLRMNSEFDKAANIYESIVAEFPEEAEAYWGLVICNYGIEYVDDPLTSKKIPTCHRASFESILNDENYQMALENADVVAQKVYRDEAREIERIRQEILDISKNEEPYDIFICYKETDDKGDRTIDSVIAQDMYDALVDKGYKVFFSRISLEDKLGRQYEPYIFAALNSAKIMLSFGTKYEYFHAVWVKNEWSRFLKLMAKDKSKVLIPCYRDMDAYDLPDEFRALQAQDMGKVGSMQDLIRGIGKILNVNTAPQPKNTAYKNGAVIEPLLKRAFMFLEDGNFASANEYCEKVLDIYPECAEAYLGKLMAECKVTKESELANFNVPFYNSDNYQKILRFGDAEMSGRIMNYCDLINSRKQDAEKQMIYNNVVKGLENAKTINDYRALSKAIERIVGYKDSVDLQKRCQEKIELFDKELSYNKAQQLLKNSKSLDDVKEAEKILTDIIDFKNSRELIDNDCKKSVEAYELCDALNKLLKENKTQELEFQLDRSSKSGRSETLEKIIGRLSSDDLKPFLSHTSYSYYANKIDLLRTFINGRIDDVVKLGKYKNEPIHWQILDKKDSNFLLLSTDCIDCFKFNNWFGDTSWETSSIRQYLNFEFYKGVFSNGERSVVVSNEQTNDKLFLLSVEEANKYFSTNEERKAYITPYLRRVLPFDANKCRWWLRTNGTKESQIAFVDGDGSINTTGDIATSQYNAIRPALWIKIQDDILK